MLSIKISHSIHNFADENNQYELNITLRLNS